MKRYLLVLGFILSLCTNLSASHYMGGEIWWECQSDGRYVFKMKLYQECWGINYQSFDSLHTTVPGIPAIAMHNISVVDITPVCNSDTAFPHITCDYVTGNNQGGIREWSYISDTITLPSYAPPLEGWTFQSTKMARNDCSNILNNWTYPYYLWATMYPYGYQPANPCFDNSPHFEETAVVMSPTSIPQSINNLGLDKDGDSLFFEWTSPRSALNTPITSYNPGYSYNSPLPGPVLNPNNIPAVVDSKTGIISFTSFTSGAFVTCLTSSSYRNGILIAEVIREFQWVIVPFSTNESPVVSPPFPNNTANPWADTINFGETVNFQLTATDLDLLNDTISPQSVSATAGGLFFGRDYTNSNCCCPVPPCATLSPAPPIANLVNNTLTFNWATNSLQSEYGYRSIPNYKEFIFNFNYSDDYCPFSARTAKSVSIFVWAPGLPAPVMGNYSINSLNGQLTFYWTPLQDTNACFEKYLIYKKDNIFGSFYLIDSIMDINQDHYTPSGSIVSGQFFWYYIKTKTHTNISNPSTIITNYFVGLPENSENNLGFNLFCNTGNQSISLQMNTDIPKELSLQLFDCLGINHFQKSIQFNAGHNELEIPVTIKSPGVYFYRLSNSQEKYSGKILIINK